MPDAAARRCCRAAALPCFRYASCHAFADTMFAFDDDDIALATLLY